MRGEQNRLFLAKQSTSRRHEMAVLTVYSDIVQSTDSSFSRHSSSWILVLRSTQWTMSVSSLFCTTGWFSIKASTASWYQSLFYQTVYSWRQHAYTHLLQKCYTAVQWFLSWLLLTPMSGTRVTNTRSAAVFGRSYTNLSRCVTNQSSSLMYNRSVRHGPLAAQSAVKTYSADVVTLARSFLVHSPPLLWKSLIALFSMRRLISGTNFLLHFVNQLHLFMLISTHLFLLCFLHPSLLHSFSLNSKLTFLVKSFSP